MKRSRRGHPTPEELRLWQQATAAVAPLGERPSRNAPPPEPEAATPVPPPTTRVAKRPPEVRPATALSPIDRRTVSRLTRGSVAIDARIDLHGMTQQAAHGRLARFLREAQADGARVALVITGKGRPADDEAPFREDRGVLRRAVPEWLASAAMRPFVVGFGEAGPAHGGGGALYVRIRRARHPAL
jgi:DNA-nicking Smr family endonuclease